jgi:hypothetical protein
MLSGAQDLDADNKPFSMQVEGAEEEDNVDD